MRVIKFRVWDTKYKRWESPDGIGIKDGVPFSATGDGYDNDVYTYYPEYVVQQYTGLKDKNGNTSVEVYECDIIDVDGKVKGNIYEMDAGETDLVIQGFGTKTWCKTYNEAISRGCHDSE